jgi:O-antigen/teichoic acid export membrane protein
MRQGIAWLFASNTGNQVLSFAVGIVLARLLAPEDFGMLLAIQVFTGFAGLISGGGMGQALVRAKDVTQADYDIVFTMQLIIGCVIYAGFFFSAPWLGRWYNNPLYADLLRVLALSFLVRPFINLPVSILHRQMRYRAQAYVGIATLLVSSATSIPLAYFGHGVWSLVWGGLAAALANAIIQAPLSKWRPGISFDFRRGRTIARYGMLVSVNNVVGYLRGQATIFILSRTLGPASVGLYNKGESLSRMPHVFITGSVYHVLFRTLASEQDNLDKSRYLFYRSLALVAVYATPFYVALPWVAQPLVAGIYGAKWLDAAGPLSILALAWPFWFLGSLSGAVLDAHNWLHKELPVQVFALAISVLAILAALPYGIDGVAWAIVGTSAYSALHLYWLATRCLESNVSEIFSALLPTVILNIPLALALYAANTAAPNALSHHDLGYVFWMSAIGALVYGACFLYLPIPYLETERRRWKSRLRLAKGVAS